MAGAISAGAYSAGVFDFLIQALTAWEAQRPGSAEKVNIPSHRVGLKVLSGASAGAIVSALGTVALARGVERTRFENARQGSQKYQCVLPSLYTAWVTRPSMVAPSGARDLLTLDDIDPGRDVVSLLDSKLIDDIESEAIVPPPREENRQVYPFVSARLDTFLMLTNMHGVAYSVPMVGGSYGMMSHHDRAHYRVTNLGTWHTDSPFCDQDKCRTIDAKEFCEAGVTPPEWRTFADCAISSSAFPVGLAPRELNFTWNEYFDRSWPMSIWHTSGINPDPKVYPQRQSSDPFVFLTVDGGAINNEPLEYARFALMSNPPVALERRGDIVDRAVIMIDPFPEPPTSPGGGALDREIVHMASALLGVLENQARFKPSELALAASESVYSRYLIAPHRTKPGQQREEPFAIAASLLGGFGGFLSEKFREHDFQLGRRNCQQFLRASFALPRSNPIVASWAPDVRDDPRFLALAEQGEEEAFCVIPLLGDAKDEVLLPAWPRITMDELDALMERIKARVEKLLTAVLSEKVQKRFLKILAQIASALTRSTLLETIKFTVLADLVRRDQIEGWQMPPALAGLGLTEFDVRNVIASLLDPSFERHSCSGLARTTGLQRSQINSIIHSCLSLQSGPYRVWQAIERNPEGEPLYTPWLKKPSSLSQLPVARQVLNWWAAPSTDSDRS